MPDEVASWDDPLGTGLISDFDFTVDNASFGVGEFGTYLSLSGRTDNPDLPDTELRFSCGKDWSSVDGGRSVQHEKNGKTKTFNESSNMGILIDRCRKDLGIGPVLMSRGSMFDAAVWVGLKFHIENINVAKEGKDARQRQMPTSFLGEAGGSTTASTPTTTTSTNGSAPAGASLRDQVEAIARSTESFDEFKAKACAIPGVTADPIIAEVVAENGIFASIRSTV